LAKPGLKLRDEAPSTAVVCCAEAGEDPPAAADATAAATAAVRNKARTRILTPVVGGPFPHEFRAALESLIPDYSSFKRLIKANV
jgi:hypothetical protein